MVAQNPGEGSLFDQGDLRVVLVIEISSPARWALDKCLFRPRFAILVKATSAALCGAVVPSPVQVR